MLLHKILLVGSSITAHSRRNPGAVGSPNSGRETVDADKRQLRQRGFLGELRRSKRLLHAIAPGATWYNPRIAEEPWESWLPEVTRLTQVAPSEREFRKKRALRPERLIALAAGIG